MYTLVFIRHGESVWNLENRFTGWTDIDLTARGIEQAKAAGRALKDNGIDFDVTYTSMLKRAIGTLWYCLDEMDRTWLPMIHSWRLNERHYGSLQGLNKDETAQKYGQAQVMAWRRNYDIQPPPLDINDSRSERKDIRYTKLSPEQIPLTESLKDTVMRVNPLWEESIAPAIKIGKRIIIAAHGNSLRAMIKRLENLSDTEIIGVNLPNSNPLIYELDRYLQPINKRYLLPLT